MPTVACADIFSEPATTKQYNIILLLQTFSSCGFFSSSLEWRDMRSFPKMNIYSHQNHMCHPQGKRKVCLLLTINSSIYPPIALPSAMKHFNHKTNAQKVENTHSFTSLVTFFSRSMLLLYLLFHLFRKLSIDNDGVRMFENFEVNWLGIRSFTATYFALRIYLGISPQIAEYFRMF